MAYNSNFDVDAVMGVLGRIGEQFQDGAPEDEALRIAAVALLYVRENGKRRRMPGSRRGWGRKATWFVSRERASGSFLAGRAAG
ncbi:MULTISPECIES: hypothetical protein [Corallococcus]|uniref:hypothetical protein n=1 Tax=Corallococcus TaxID=83461 RepID=UPI0026CE1120|nr:hypothetical protein [Corallococcus exiguus]